MTRMLVIRSGSKPGFDNAGFSHIGEIVSSFCEISTSLTKLATILPDYCLNECLQQDFELLLQLFCAELATVSEYDVQTAVQYRGKREAAALVCKGGVVHRSFVAGQEQRVVDLVLTGKTANLRFVVVGDTEHPNASLREFPMVLDQGRYFAPTGCAPWSPEIDDQNIAFPVPD